MVRRLVEWAVNSPLVVVLLAFTLIGVGSYAFLNVNVEAYPDPAPAIVEVVAQYPGASAGEVERQVTIPPGRSPPRATCPGPARPAQITPHPSRSSNSPPPATSSITPSTTRRPTRKSTTACNRPSCRRASRRKSPRPRPPAKFTVTP